MKLAFDVSPLHSGHAGRGVGYYTKNLLAGLRDIKSLTIKEFLSSQEINDVDIIHYPFFDLFQPTLRLKGKIPTVVTIHDVTPLVFPNHYPPGIKGRLNLWRQRLSLRNISAVITVSEYSKKDISKYLKIRPEKIFVTPEAPGSNFNKIHETGLLEKVRLKYNLPDRYALYIGNVNWNKNLLGLTKASIEAGVDLVLVGKSFKSKVDLNHPEMASYKDFIKQFAKNPLVHILGFVSDEDINLIMNLADLFLFPSFYEGFGLPVLEAQVCGIPVITSNTSSLPSVAGKGALLVDPFNTRSISSAISKIMTNKTLREYLITEGIENVKHFSWRKTTTATVKVYSYATKS